LLKSAEQIYPKAFNLYNAMGYVYLEKNETDRAIEAFHKAINVYLEKNETDRAIEAFHKAINLHPEDEAGYCDLAYAYHKKGNTDLSHNISKKLKKLIPKSKFGFDFTKFSYLE